MAQRGERKRRREIHLRYGRRDIRPITIGNPSQGKIVQTKISKLVVIVTSISAQKSALGMGGGGGKVGFVRIFNDLSSIKIKMGLRRHRARNTYIQWQILQCPFASTEIDGFLRHTCAGEKQQ